MACSNMGSWPIVTGLDKKKLTLKLLLAFSDAGNYSKKVKLLTEINLLSTMLQEVHAHLWFYCK